MQTASDMIIRFEGFELDLRRGCLRADDREIDLRPKSFEVLRYLLEHAGRVVTREELTKAVWADVVVGEYLWAATRAVIYGVVFLIVMAAFGLVHSPWALLAPPVFLIGALTFAVLGMAYTALVSNIEQFNILFTGIITPMFLFGGVFFPFSGLPEWAQVVGWCLPLSHLVAATRDLTLGGADLMTLAHVGFLVAVLVAVFPFPAARMRRTLLR